MTDEMERPPDELLVDVGDERLVRGQLEQQFPGVQVIGVDTEPRLGLTRLRLTDVHPAVEAAAGPAGDDPMNALVETLRLWAKDLRGGPLTIDRTRETSSVSSLPHVKGGGVPEPLLSLNLGDRVTPGRPSGPRVGIADALPFAHPDLGGHIVGEQLVSSGPFVTGLPGHATFVIGTVLKRAPTAVAVCRPVLAATAIDPTRTNTVWDVAGRLLDFLDDDIEVLNMSFGCRTIGAEPLPLRRAVQTLRSHGIVPVAAGGNTGDEIENPAYPAAFTEVLSVGERGTTANADWLDLLAPGDMVRGPFLLGRVLEGLAIRSRSLSAIDFPSGYAVWSGSSFAAANVTGEIASRIARSGITAAEARDQLLSGESVDEPTRAHGGDITPAHAKD